MGYDVIVIGAGASGLVAAIAAARQGSTVLVIEQKEKAGKKILATGNGKCNYTNLYQSPECYRSDDSSFVMKVLSHFDTTKTIHFFRELGIYPKEREGYLYPNSEQAASVLSVLMMECERLKVVFHYQETVKEIKRPNYTVITQVNADIDQAKEIKKKDKTSPGTAGGKLSPRPDLKSAGYVKSSLEKENGIKSYFAKRLILATGGCASMKLGSDGSGYALAKAFGHTIIKPLPALVQLKSQDKYCKTVSGVRVQAAVSAYADQRLIAREDGELLFTDYGISGIPILQISRFVAKALDQKKKVYLILDFLPDVTKEELLNMMYERLQQNPAKTLEEMLIGLLNHKLAFIILKEVKLDPCKNSKLTSKPEMNRLVQQIKEFPMNITETNSFENAQVTAGGISLKELEPATMESRLSEGLYITGELADVDGTCGGYNLQWAWSSGYVAGTSAGKK